MKTIYAADNIFFKVLRSGTKKIEVQEGCVYSFGGKGQFVAWGYGIYSPSIIHYTGYPGDDLGSHTMIDSEEFEITENTKVWLKYDLTEEETYSKVTIVNDGPTIPIIYDQAYAVLKVKDIFLNKDSIAYEVSPDGDQAFASDTKKYILLATITMSDDSITINQVHEGILIVNRYQEIINTLDSSLIIDDTL